MYGSVVLGGVGSMEAAGRERARREGERDEFLLFSFYLFIKNICGPHDII